MKRKVEQGQFGLEVMSSIFTGFSNVFQPCFIPADLEKEAIAKITALAAMPSGGMALAKNNRVEVVRLRYDRIRKADADGFLNCWFNPSVRELLKETAKKF